MPSMNPNPYQSPTAVEQDKRGRQSLIQKGLGVWFALFPFWSTPLCVWMYWIGFTVEYVSPIWPEGSPNHISYRLYGLMFAG